MCGAEREISKLVEGFGVETKVESSVAALGDGQVKEVNAVCNDNLKIDRREERAVFLEEFCGCITVESKQNQIIEETSEEKNLLLA
jgi:hypothetical protein